MATAPRQRPPIEAVKGALLPVMKYGMLFRYGLLQLPGTLLIGALLWWAVSSDWLRPGAALLLLLGWLLKDVLLYPAFRWALQPPPPIGGAALLGREGVLSRPAAPVGQLRLAGELWSARARGDRPLVAGTRVRVVAARGLVLIVDAVDQNTKEEKQDEHD